MHHVQIAQRAFNTPLMVDPSKALAFLSGLGPRITGQDIIFQGAELADHDVHRLSLPSRASLIGGTLTAGRSHRDDLPFTFINGIAVIGIAGTLVHRGAWIGQSSGLTSYEGLAMQIDAAMSDPAVRGIALDIDSFGGEVAGAFDLADRIRAARETKPVHAFVAEHALSAGYALASQATHITLPRTGAVGSIGVVALHAEMSGMLEQKGVAVTLIHAGAHKSDANPYQPLPGDVRGRMQAELEDLRQLFARTVAAGRGNRLSVEAALATEAAILRGEAAVAAGLADAVADPRAAFQAFAESLSASRAIIPTIPIRSLKETPMKPEATAGANTDAETQDTLPVVTPDPASPANPPATDAPAEPQAEPALALSPEAIRAEAAEVAGICAQAARLGVTIDAADAVGRGLKPDALRAKILADLAARGDAAGITATAPAVTAPKPSPIVAAARKSAGIATS